MKKIHIFICTLFWVASVSDCFAQTAKVDKNASGQAYIDTSGIYAEFMGKGSTKEEAEQAAYTYAILQIVKQINELSPDKFKMMWQGYNLPIQKICISATHDDKIIEDKGVDKIITDKSFIEGYWEYVEGSYTYNLRIAIEFHLTEAEPSSSNSTNTEKAETPSKIGSRQNKVP